MTGSLFCNHSYCHPLAFREKAALRHLIEHEALALCSILSVGGAHHLHTTHSIKKKYYYIFECLVLVFTSLSLQAAVWQALNHYAYLDAVFLAERLYAEGNSFSLFMLHLSHLSLTCLSHLCLSEVRGGAVPVGHMLLPLGEAVQSVPAVEGSQLFHAAGSIPAGKVLRGAQQVRKYTDTHRNVNTQTLTSVSTCRVYLFVRLAEGEQVLIGGVLNKQKSQDDIITEFGDSASFTLSLLGHIYW